MKLIQDRIVLAHKYAQAFFQLFSSHFTQDMYERITISKRILQSHAKTIRILLLFASDKNETFLLAQLLLEKALLPDFFLQLIILLIESKRLELLPLILQQLELLYLEQENIEEIIIGSSSALQQEQIDTILSFISRQRRKKIIYTVQIDPLLIAGIWIHAKQFVWEYSVRSQLRTIRI